MHAYIKHTESVLVSLSLCLSVCLSVSLYLSLALSLYVCARAHSRKTESLIAQLTAKHNARALVVAVDVLLRNDIRAHTNPCSPSRRRWHTQLGNRHRTSIPACSCICACCRSRRCSADTRPRLRIHRYVDSSVNT